ncbi:hypothetical protein ACH4HG_00555 [Streptomyces coeruleorubidus]|uniref:hypothetical protein n=1 Tax=Streptomyces coeruleorubidus TaxID=116188 RepID=UPI0037AA508E
MNDSRHIPFSCGPVVSTITLREVTVGAELAATGEEAKLLTGDIQVFVPLTTTPFRAVFTLDTMVI